MGPGALPGASRYWVSSSEDWSADRSFFVGPTGLCGPDVGGWGQAQVSGPSGQSESLGSAGGCSGG
jgi:hypothetical protein